MDIFVASPINSYSLMELAMAYFIGTVKGWRKFLFDVWSQKS